MPPRQTVPRPCGCVDEVWGWRQGQFQGQELFTTLCQQHLSIANNQGSTPQPNTTSPQMQTSTTIPGIPSNLFFPPQMAGFGHPFQMPPQGVHIRMPQPGTGR